MTPQEKNAAVARKLGMKDLQYRDSGTGRMNLVCFDNIAFGETVPDYVHDIKAAWEIPGKYPTANGDGQFYVIRYGKEWEAGWFEFVSQLGWGPILTARADTAPMAIVDAFLKLESQ